jgi:type II secretory pathway component PulF
MKYTYIAVDRQGLRTKGELEAASLDLALRQLASQDLQPVTVVPASEGHHISMDNLFSGSINTADKIFLTRYLSLMLKVGTDLLSAINILIDDFQKPAVRNFLIEVRRNLAQGQQFYVAFAAHPQVFSAVFVNLVRAAEQSGTLQATFEQLTDQLQRDDEVNRQVRTAMVYPIILLVVAVVIIVFLSLFALPRISKVFSDTAIEPPLFSRIVFSVGGFVGDHVYLLAALAAALGLGFYFGVIRTITGRRLLQRTLARTPVVRNIYRDLAVQRFASTLSSLLRAGLPIIDSLHITADVVGVESFQIAIRRIADEGLARGLSIADSFRRETAFPAVITNLIAISEKAGHLEEVLGTIAEFYTKNIQASIKSLVAFLEPALLLVMGLMVAVVALAIIIPIYQLTTNF